jgi:hypothetical protein
MAKQSGKFNVDGGRLIAKYQAKYQAAAMDALEKEFVNTSGRIIEDSPIGIPNAERYTTKPQGNFRHNWQIAKKTSNRVLSGSSKKGFDYASGKIRSKLMNGGSLYLFNNSPQARVIEYGGYPNPVKKGTYRKGRGYEKRSSGGFSRQAPQGIVRKNLAGFGTRFKARAKKALRGVK